MREHRKNKPQKFKSMEQQRKPKLIKYAEIVADKGRNLPADDERAIADFRAFYALGDVHTKRVKSRKALEVMFEILENLQNNLQTRKKVIS